MEEKPSVSFNLRNTTNTSVKRLGLSVKRKNSCFYTGAVKKGHSSTEKPSCSISGKSEETILDMSKNSNLYYNTPQPTTVEWNSLNSKTAISSEKINYEDEIKALKLTIYEKEQILQTLKLKRNIENLENLTELWKNGCKNAYLHFINLLKEKDPECIEVEKALRELGISKIITENFEIDSNIFVSDSSQ